MKTFVYVEGGGGALRDAYRRAFRALLSQAAPGVAIEIRVCGSGSMVLPLWKAGRDKFPEDHHIMLIDTEGIIPLDRTDRLAEWRGLPCRDENLGLMASCTESWILAAHLDDKQDWERLEVPAARNEVKKRVANSPGTPPEKRKGFEKHNAPEYLLTARWSKVARLTQAKRFAALLNTADG